MKSILQTTTLQTASLQIIFAAALCAATSIAIAAPFSQAGGTIRFSGAIVESPCTFSTAATELAPNNIRADCPRPAAFTVSFNTAKNPDGPALNHVSLTQDGKALSKDQAQRVNMQFTGSKSLDIVTKFAKHATEKKEPVIMTVSYL